MWNLISIDNVRPIKGGSPYMMAHETFHHTFTLPLLNKFAPLTIINQQQQQHKEFPEFKEQFGKNNKKMVVQRNYINYNQGSYDCINRIMGKQQNTIIQPRWLDFIEESPPKSATPPLKQIQKTIETPIKIEIEIEIKQNINDEQKQPKIDDKKKKKRRRKRRKNRNKNKKNHEESDKNLTTIKLETNYDNLNNLNLIKNQRQRQISTDSDDSFIVFYDDNNDKDVDNHENLLKINNNNNNTRKKTIETNKKVRFADDELCEIHPMVKWSYAYQAARKGPWEEYARDRDRFKKRIKNLEKILLPILDKRHRQKIYQKRFTDKE